MFNSVNKRIRLTSWVISGFVKKQKQALLISIGIGVVIFLLLKFFMPYATEVSFFRQKTRIGIVAKVNKDNIPSEILEKLSFGLLENTPDGLYLPMAASDITVSDDYLSYTATLTKNLYWTDDKKVKSNQIQYDIEGVELEYPNDGQIVFKIKEAFSPFLSLLEKPIFRENLVGLGEYKLRKIVYENQLIKQIVIFNNQEEIIYRFYPSLSRLLNAFRLGEINQFTNTKPDLLSKKEDKVQVEEQISDDTYVALFFNTEDQLLSEKSIRQALSYAIKDKSLGEKEALTSIRLDSFAYFDKIKKYPYNQEKAKEFFEDIDKELVFKISTISDFLPQAEKIKSDWEETLGIKVAIELINVMPNDFQVLLLPQAIPLDPDQYALWHSTQSDNIARFKNPKIDKLLEDGRIEQNTKKRAEIYADLQKVLSEEVPAIFLYFPKKWLYLRL